MFDKRVDGSGRVGPQMNWILRYGLNQGIGQSPFYDFIDLFVN